MDSRYRALFTTLLLAAWAAACSGSDEGARPDEDDKLPEERATSPEDGEDSPEDGKGPSGPTGSAELNGGEGGASEGGASELGTAAPGPPATAMSPGTGGSSGGADVPAGTAGQGGGGEEQPVTPPSLQCALESARWTDVAERPGDESAGEFVDLPGFAAGYFEGKVYAAELHGQDLLWTYDLCSGEWQSQTVDWGGLPAVLRTVTWEGDHFLGVEGGAMATEGYRLDLDGSVSAVQLPAPEEIPSPDWTDPEAPDTSRYVTWANSERFSMGWGNYGLLAEMGPNPEDPHIKVYGNGQIYDRQSGSWSPVNMAGAPSPRFSFKMIPVAERFFIWGGYGDEDWPNPAVESELRDGGIYDPVADSWTKVSAEGAPEQTEVAFGIQPYAQTDMKIHLVGDYVVVIGDDNSETRGGIYQLSSDSWRVLPAPPRRLPLHEARLTTDGNLLYLTEDEPALLLNPAQNQWLELDYSSSPAQDERGADGERGWAIDLWTGDVLFRWGEMIFTPFGCSEDGICEGGGITATRRHGGVVALAPGL